MRPTALLFLFSLLLGCTDIEGNEPGECEDGADNDEDGYFDCADRDCWGSPVCGGPGQPVGDDDDASDDDDAADDDDGADDDDAVDDDDATADDDDASDDDDATAGGTVPYIANVNYQYQAPNLVFSIEAYDPDGNFGSPLLLWSVNGSPQPTQTIPSASPGEAFFNITLSGITAGETYQVLFAIRDADGNVSDGYSLSATAS